MSENNENIIIGQVECPASRVHIFRSMEALLDFIAVFKIQNGSFQSGITADGQKAYQLVYNSSNQQGNNIVKINTGQFTKDIIYGFGVDDTDYQKERRVYSGKK